jgi:hypothetical protein
MNLYPHPCAHCAMANLENEVWFGDDIFVRGCIMFIEYYLGEVS